MLNVKLTSAPVGYFYQVYIGERFTGFTLLTPEQITFLDVIDIYLAQDIILQEELSYGSNFTFSDIDLESMKDAGAVAIVCESNQEDEEHEELINYLRVVKKGYNPNGVYTGFTHP